MEHIPQNMNNFSRKLTYNNQRTSYHSGFISDRSPGSPGLPDFGWDFQLEVLQKFTLFVFIRIYICSINKYVVVNKSYNVIGMLFFHMVTIK